MTANFHSAICGELLKMEEDMLYTEKAHFVAAEELRKVNLWVGLVATVAAAASVASIVASGPKVISGVLGLLAAIASATMTFVRPEEKAAQHLSAAKALGVTRVKTRQYREIDLNSEQPEHVAEWRRMVTEIGEAKGRADHAAPSISERRFQKARRKIQAGDFSHDSV